MGNTETTSATNPHTSLTDQQLLAAAAHAVAGDRKLTAELLTLLGELDARRLYLGEGFSSLFAYCTQALHMSEHAAYHRIEAARAARYFPMICSLVADGSITLTTIVLLRPHLTQENHGLLLTTARHKTKREVEHQVACLAPMADVTTLVRRLPNADATKSNNTELHETKQSEAKARLLFVAPSSATTPAPVPARTTPHSHVAPLSTDRYLLRVTLSAAAHAHMNRAQELMRHVAPTGDPATIIERALATLVADLERRKIANVNRPRREPQRSSMSRGIPASVRRAVWKRDDGRCSFGGALGRCTETNWLEFHHVVPFARGGPSTVDNLALRCRAHNQYEGRRDFGDWRGRQ